jgi:hypothetical protein
MEIASNQAIFLLYISERIPAGILDKPLETFIDEKIKAYDTSVKFKDAFNRGPITVRAPCPKCFIPCPRDRPITKANPENELRNFFI